MRGIFCGPNFIFPSFPLFSLFQMYRCRCLVIKAHVRTPVVIEPDVPSNDLPGLFGGIELPAPVDAFRLDNAVDTLGYGIIGRLVVLGHADGDVMIAEQFHITVTTVLYAAVGMMYKSFQILAPPHGRSLFYCLGEGFSTQPIILRE